MKLQHWDARIARAELLASRYSFAAEFLKFYAAVARAQKNLSSDISSQRGRAKPQPVAAPLRNALDLPLFLPHFSRFLEAIAPAAPPPLSAHARTIAAQSPADSAAMLAKYWENGCRFEPVLDEPSTFCARSFLQPCAELLADSRELPPPAISRASCPLCDGLPQLGILRPEGDGARRSLLCSFCAVEWDYRRILCPSCGEEDERKLCVYAAKEFDYLRVEACDSCKIYIVTVDLSKDGHAIPFVDDLAAVPLSLWAGEQGYTRLQKNLLGL